MGGIWAIARHTVAASMRMKIALFFIVLLGVLTLGLPFAAEGDASVSGAVQSFLAYSIGAVSFLLSCLTVFLAWTLSSEIVGKQILTLMTKPLGRSQYVLGKWLGIIILDGVLLLFSGIIIYGMTMYIASREPRDEFDKHKLNTQILQARHASKFILPDFTAVADAQFEKNITEGVYANIEDFDEAKEKFRLLDYLQKRWRSVWPLEMRQFEFEDVRCDRSSPDATIQIRYESRVANYPPNEILQCQWYVGNRQKDTELYHFNRRDVIDRRHTLTVPADAVAEDNTLLVTFLNVDPSVPEGAMQHPATVIFEGDDSIQVLFSVSSFWSNLVRTLLLVMCRLAFLAAFAVSAATVVSFPVAALASLVVYTLAAMRGFISDSADWLYDEGVPMLLQTAIDNVFAASYFLIPDFSQFNGIENLVDGRNVPLMWVLLGIGKLVFIKTGILLLIGCLLFHRREVSEVSL